jgi:lactate permease
MGPALPDVIAGLGSIVCLMVFLRFWTPKTIWRFDNEPAPALNTEVTYSGGQIIRAWSPFIVLTITIIAWGCSP